MSVIYGLWWTFIFVLVVAAVLFGAEGAATVAGVVGRVLGSVAGFLVGILSRA